MSDTITKEQMALAGITDRNLVSYVGTSLSVFARDVVQALTIGLAKARLCGSDTVKYSVDGQSAEKSIDDAIRTISYFKTLANDSGGPIFMPIEFSRNIEAAV
jgi:hypothetical protein